MTSRTSLLVPFLLGLAFAATVLAGALAIGAVPQLIGSGPTPAATQPPLGTPDALPTAEPTAELTAEPTAELTPEPTVEPTPDAQPTPGGTYVVQSGDTLFGIGLMFGVPWELIAEANGIEAPYVIRVGQELVIPVPSPPDPDSDDTYYVVQPGDTIGDIAYELGVSEERLIDLNNLENPDEIFVGQRLLIPGRQPAETPEPTEEP